VPFANVARGVVRVDDDDDATAAAAAETLEVVVVIVLARRRCIARRRRAGQRAAGCDVRRGAATRRLVGSVVISDGSSLEDETETLKPRPEIETT
jgi:hypothetical protein